MKEIKDRLLQLLRQHSLKIGHFTLTSGATSHYYFDSKLTTLHPEGAYLSALLVLEELKSQGIEADAIGGLTLGADPIVSAVAAVSFAQRDQYRPLPAFIVRKEPKKHGTQRYLEGFSGEPGSRVVIVDDVCTTGGSTLHAIRRAEEAGFQVVAVLCLIDREEGGREALRDYPFHPLLTSRELLDEPSIQAQIRRLEQAPDAAPRP